MTPKIEAEAKGVFASVAACAGIASEGGADASTISLGYEPVGRPSQRFHQIPEMPSDLRVWVSGVPPTPTGSAVSRRVWDAFSAASAGLQVGGVQVR